MHGCHPGCASANLSLQLLVFLAGTQLSSCRCGNIRPNPLKLSAQCNTFAYVFDCCRKQAARSRRAPNALLLRDCTTIQFTSWARPTMSCLNEAVLKNVVLLIRHKRSVGIVKMALPFEQCFFLSQTDILPTWKWWTVERVFVSMIKEFTN